MGEAVRLILTDEAWIAMNHAARHDEATCTDVVSRALVLYSLIDTAEAGAVFRWVMKNGVREVLVQQ